LFLVPLLMNFTVITPPNCKKPTLVRQRGRGAEGKESVQISPLLLCFIVPSFTNQYATLGLP
ncbi:hypothetical protein ACEYW6_36305, partial [Nostoc sp. UIC 10607]|uniref:hypothetical protein n=1 Tax=Nostoc sp. UIC 10607 TaxID=3045935 RepID=UPI00399F44D6